MANSFLLNAWEWTFSATEFCEKEDTYVSLRTLNYNVSKYVKHIHI